MHKNIQYAKTGYLNGVSSLNKEKGYPISVLYNILALNRSSYYKWLHRDQSVQEAKDATLIEYICQLYQESNGIFGYRRMQLNLKRRFGLICNKKRVHRVMRAIGLKSVIRRKRPNYIKSLHWSTVRWYKGQRKYLKT